MKKFPVVILWIMLAFILTSCDVKEKEEKKEESGNKAPAIKTLCEDVTLSISIDNIDNKKPIITGITNLPDKTYLMLGVISIDGPDHYLAQDKVVVKDGLFRSNQFSYHGNSLPNGEYIVEISTPFAGVQPEFVRTIIGEDGEYLKGAHVIEEKVGSLRQKLVKVEKRFKISGSATKRIEPKPVVEWINPEELEIGKTYQLVKDTSLCDDYDPVDPMRAIAEMRKMNKYCQIKIMKKVIKNGGIIYYFVDVLNEKGKKIDKGWVNSLALYDIKEIK